MLEKKVELKQIQIKFNILSITKIGVLVDNLILIELLIYFLYKEKIKKDSLKKTLLNLLNQKSFHSLMRIKEIIFSYNILIEFYVMINQSKFDFVSTRVKTLAPM